MGPIGFNSVLAQYGITPIRIYSFGKVWKIKTKTGSFALKKMSQNPEKVLFFLAAMEYLWQQGFQQMSQVIKSLDGDLLVKRGDESFFLTEWIEGRPVNPLDPEEWNCSIEMLAQMHRLGEGFVPPAGCIPKNDIGRWPRKWAERIADLKKMAVLASQGQTPFDFIFIRLIPKALAQAQAAIEILEKVGYQEYCAGLKKIPPLCHRDFVYHNIIIREGQVYLIDFEYCVQDTRVTDLARLVRTSWINHPWERDRAGEIVVRYHSYYPLREVELKLLEAALMFPHKVWRTGHRWYFSHQSSQHLYEVLSGELDWGNGKEEVLEELRKKCTPLRS